MKRFALIAAAFALVVAACGGAGEVVATVDGTPITISDVEALSAQGETGSLSQEQFAEDLRNAIVEVVLVNTAEQDFGISFTEEEIEARRAELQAQIESETGSTYQEFLEQAGFTDDRIRRIAHQQLIAEAVEEALLRDAAPISDAEVEEAYQSQRPALTEACVSHILVETEEEALTVRDRLTDGAEDFGEVAAEVSIDPSAPQNQGDLGCGPLVGYVTEFVQRAMEAPVGEVSEPVETQFGFHLILVESRETDSLEEARPSIVEQLQGAQRQELLRSWVLEAIGSAEIEVDPEYGRWVSAPLPQVLPPE